MKSNSLLFRALEFYGNHLHHRGQWFVHQKLRDLLRADVDADLEVTRDGLRWVLNPSDYVQAPLFWLGTHDYWDIYHIKKLLRPGDVIFDVGANFGYYSIALATALQKACQVHAFEPNFPTYQRLVRHIELNNLGDVIAVHRVALSDVAGMGSMVGRPDNSGAASVHPGEGDIVLTTLDAFCQAHQVSRLDFMKIDIEGFEEKLLQGGTESIPRFNPILFIELQPTTLTREGSSVERVVDLLRGFGYQLYTHRRDQLSPLRRLPTGSELVNAFCVPTQRSDRLS